MKFKTVYKTFLSSDNFFDAISVLFTRIEVHPALVAQLISLILSPITITLDGSKPNNSLVFLICVKRS